MRNADYTGIYIVSALLLINFLIAVGFFVCAIFNIGKAETPERRQYVLTAFCVLLGPVVVPAVMLLGHLLSKLLYRDAGDLAAVTFSKDRVEIAASGDFDIEANLVPIREALSISDTVRLRRLMLDVLRNGAGSALPKISEALQSPDSETSHYAAAAIIDVLSDFRSAAARLSGDLKEHPEDIAESLELLELLIEFIPQGVLHDNELDFYTKMSGDVAENLFNIDRGSISAKHYLGLINAYIDIGDIGTASVWDARAAEFHPAELETYVGRMRLCFETHNNEKFLETLDSLKKSGIIVDKNTMELIRLFM